MIQKKLNGNGDFRSQECIDLLKEADIVVTNPPFSLFREYLNLLMEHDKRFIIITNLNCIAYVDVFKEIKNNKIWLGTKNNVSMEFLVPENYESNIRDEYGNKKLNVGNICWFTNLSHKKINNFLILSKTYNPEEYPKYDNYPAININKTKNIPMDYPCLMGVPISFMTKYNPEQFEIISNNNLPIVNGKNFYKRIIIKHKTL